MVLSQRAALGKDNVLNAVRKFRTIECSFFFSKQKVHVIKLVGVNSLNALSNVVYN